MKKVIEGLRSSNLLLASKLQQQWQSHSAINALHIFCLNQIEARPGFSGARGVGVHSRIGVDSDVDDIIASEYADAEIAQQEEHVDKMESMGRYLDSMVD